ncbi:acyltransferase family protein [Chitinimonas sp.]|uniref:acyltransferase family protein n=1 Tax=Chitinimonas sp. TaxID=1934313 RepID=UPI0035AE29B3
MKPVTAAEGPRELVADQLRAIAALMVAAYHCFLGFYTLIAKDSPASLLAIFIPFNGSAGVSLFFVLSGYILLPSLDRLRGKSLVAGRFIVRRLFRILPAWWFSICLGALFAWSCATVALPGEWSLVRAEQGWWSLWLHNALLLDVGLGSHNLNPVGWTLQVEMLAAPLIYLFWRMLQSWPLAVLLSALALWVLFHHFATPWPGAVYFAQFAFMFLLGGWLRQCHPYVAALAGRRRWLALAAMLPALALWLGASAKPLLQLHPAYFLLVGVGAAGVLFAAEWLSLAPGRLGRWLGWLGLVSYSFYLLHWMLMLAIAAGFYHLAPALLGHPVLFGVLLCLSSIPLAIWLAGFSHDWIEQPAIRWGRRLEARLFGGASCAPPQTLTRSE